LHTPVAGVRWYASAPRRRHGRSPSDSRGRPQNHVPRRVKRGEDEGEPSGRVVFLESGRRRHWPRGGGYLLRRMTPTRNCQTSSHRPRLPRLHTRTTGPSGPHRWLPKVLVRRWASIHNGGGARPTPPPPPPPPLRRDRRGPRWLGDGFELVDFVACRESVREVEAEPE
jgi:hypothetical protein